MAVSLKNKPSIPQLIDNLPFVKVVDMMLLEGTAAADVAKFIQDDQKALTDVKLGSLSDALAKRRKDLRKQAMDQSAEETKRWLENGHIFDPNEEEDDEDADSGADVISFPAPDRMVPGIIARKIYDRVIQGGIDELVELEALYRAQVHRVDRLTRLEEDKNGYIERLGKEYDVAKAVLMARVAVKEKFGVLDGDKKFREQLDIQGYSEDTVKTLSNPESRHRVISLVEKLARLEKKKKLRTEEEQEKKSSEG